MKKAFILTILLISQFSLRAQDWESLITDGGSSGNEIVSDMDVDQDGNIYIIGTFSGTVSFGNIFLSSNGSNDFFVAKYDSSGAVIYAVNYGSTASDFGNAIVADNSGNVYITGQFNQAFTFAGSILGCFGETDIFTAKLDSLGNAVWARRAGAIFNIYGDPFRDRGLDITLDNTNGVYVSGVFGGQSMTFGALTLSGVQAIDFIGKYDTNGNEIWIVNASISNGFSNNAIAHVIEFNPLSNSLVVAGENKIGLFIGPGGQSRLSDIYLRQLLLNGTQGWYREITGGTQEVPESLNIDSNGNIYLVGKFNGTLDFPLGNSVLVSLNNGQDEEINDGFVLKFNSNASSLLYAKSIIGNDNIEVRDTYSDQGGSFYITGLFNGAPTIDNIPIASSGLSDIFLIRLSNSGSIEWIETAGGSSEDLGTNVVVRNDSKIILSGGFNGTSKFGNQFVNSKGFSDIFIAQIDCKSNIPPIYNGNIQVCLGDTSVYSIPSKIGTDYLWSLASGGILDTTGGLIKVIWTTPGNHILSATPSNVCGLGETRNQTINVNDVPGPPQVIGDTSICLGLETYNILNPSAQSYQWNLSAGGSLVPLNNQALVSWTNTGNYTLSVTGTNECGLGASETLNISVAQFPSGPFIISGNSISCFGQDTFSINTQAETTFNWTLSGGGTIQSFDSIAVVNWTQPGTFIVRATPSNICGTGSASSQIVNVKSSPQNIQIQGDTSSCLGSASYTLPNISDGIYTWNVSGGGNLISLGSTAIINWLIPGNYIVTARVQNDCGQSNVDSFNVQIRTSAIQPSQIAGSNSVCFGSSNYSVSQQVDQSYSWTLSSGGTLNFVNNQASVNWTQTGFHTLIVSSSNNCGAGLSRSLVVEVKNVPGQPGVIFGNDEVCLGLENYNVFAESGITYNWNISGGGQIFPSGNSVSVNWTQAGIYDLIITTSNACGNGISRVLPIEVKTVPANVNGITGIDTVCLGTQTYSVTNPQIDNSINYNWTLSGGGIIAPNGNSANVTWTSPGIYTITVRPQNQCGFGQAFSKIVRVNNTSEQITSINGNNQVCLDTLNYSVSLIGGFTYNWFLSGGGVLNANSNQAEVIWQNTGNYNLSVSTSDGCTKSLSINVLDIPQKPSSIGGDTIVCKGSKSYAMQSRAGETFNWSVSSGGNLSAFGNAAIVNWTATGIHEINVSASNICGIGDSSKINVNVLDIPQKPVFVSGDTLICLGQSETYKVFDKPFENYTWNLSRAGLLNPLDSIAVINWLDTGGALISVSATNLCGIGPSESYGVQIKDVPRSPSIIGPSLVCIDTSIYSSTFSSNLNYNWSISAGPGISTNLNNASIFWQDTGLYQLQLNTNNICGSSPLSTKNIRVLDIPSKPILINGDTIVCLGLSSYQVLKRIEESYTWSISGGGSLTALDNSITVNWTNTGIHQIYVQASNICGQSLVDTIEVEVKTTPLQTSVISGTTNVCLDSVVYSVVSNPGLIYNWTLNNNGNLISGDSSSAIVDWTNTGLAIINVSASNLCGTGPSQSTSVNITDIPGKPVFTSGDTLTCLGNETYNLSTTSGLSYNWTLNGGGNLSPNGSQANVNWTQSGIWNVIASQTNYCGTGEEDTLKVRVKTLPSALNFINPDTLVCLGNVAYQVNAQPEITYSWTLNGGGNFSFVNNQAFVSWNNPGIYALEVRPVNICGNGPTTSVQIEVNKTPELPSLSNLDSFACLGQETFIVNPQGNANFLWNLSGGGGSSNNGNQLIVNWTNTGVYNIDVSAFNFCGVGPVLNQVIYVDAIPTVPQFVSGDTVLCLITENYSVAVDTNETVIWNLTSGGLLNSNGINADVEWLAPGNHVLSVRAENYCGISSALAITIETSDVPDAPLGISGKQNVCLGEEVLYQVNSVSNQTYNWSLQNGGILNSDSSSVFILWVNSREELIEVSALNICGESNKSNLGVLVKDTPKFQGGILGDVKICEGSVIQYEVNNTDDVNYQWSLSSGGELSAERNKALIDWQTSGQHEISLIAQNNCGVSNALIKAINVDQFPDKPEISSNQDTLFSSSGIDNVWFLNGEILNDTGIDFIIPDQTGRYTLKVINSCGESEESEFISYYSGEDLASEIYLIPNPAVEFVEVRIPLNINIQSLNIINLQGRQVGRISEINSNTYRFNVNNLRPGLYFVEVIAENSETVIKKLVIN